MKMMEISHIVMGFHFAARVFAQRPWQFAGHRPVSPEGRQSGRVGG